MKRTALALFLVASCAMTQALAPPRATIRVGVWTLWRDQDATVASISGATIRLCGGCTVGPLKSVAIHANNERLSWTDPRGFALSSNELLLTGSYRLTAHGESLTLGYPLRVAARSGALVLAATLPVERYVELAVAAESGAADSLESRKALAVVARSFALLPTHGHAAFDVCDSTHCQWVHWHTTREAHAAVLATAGESLWFHGSRAEAYFHRNCGGRTAAAAEVWPRGRAAQGWLVSRPDPYCQRAGSSEWSETISREELTQALAAAGLVAPGWTTLTVAQRGESGRAATLLIGDAKISTEDFRLAVGRALGWNRILSTWFEVTRQGDRFIFNGRGSGHGVGLCQAGAEQMARSGSSTARILSAYFPGTEIASQPSDNPDPIASSEHFELVYPSSQEPWVKQTLDTLEQWRKELGAHAEILPPRVRVETWDAVGEFIRATGQPGWMAASSDGQTIAVQPLELLARKRILNQTLKHELTHLVVHRLRAKGVPRWFEEGLVLYMTGEESKRRPSPSRPRANLKRPSPSRVRKPG